MTMSKQIQNSTVSLPCNHGIQNILVSQSTLYLISAISLQDFEKLCPKICALAFLTELFIINKSHLSIRICEL